MIRPTMTKSLTITRTVTNTRTSTNFCVCKRQQNKELSSFGATTPRTPQANRRTFFGLSASLRSWQNPRRTLCPTSLPAPAATVVVPGVANTMASVISIAKNVTARTTEHDVLIRRGPTTSTVRRHGDVFEQLTWQPTRCVKHARHESLWHPSSITRFRSDRAEHDSTGTISSRNARRVIRRNLRWREAGGARLRASILSCEPNGSPALQPLLNIDNAPSDGVFSAPDGLWKWIYRSGHSATSVTRLVTN